MRLYIKGDLNHLADYESVVYLTVDEWVDPKNKYALLNVLRFVEMFVVSPIVSEQDVLKAMLQRRRISKIKISSPLQPLLVYVDQ